MIDGAESSPTRTMINDAMFNNAENPNAIIAIVFNKGAVHGLMNMKYPTKIRSDIRHNHRRIVVSVGKKAEATKRTVWI
jgi:hypothetical protein